MFIYYKCDSGDFACRVPKTDERLELLSLKMRCPQCDSYIQTVEMMGGAKLMSAEELFSASMGRGMPEEQLCSPERLKGLLMNGTIADVDLLPSEADSNRSIINRMRVETINGPDLTAYFAMSTQGATIFRVVLED